MDDHVVGMRLNEDHLELSYSNRCDGFPLGVNFDALMQRNRDCNDRSKAPPSDPTRKLPITRFGSDSSVHNNHINDSCNQK
ncbi:hypothetical protein BY996DRAFT_6489507 [Phakopsora pachyrhizi]|nr:hypothetical protein BY996DRAFT_6489507 [Phakopsora pachyrhizi]